MTALQKMLLELGVEPRSVAELTREKHWREKMVPIDELYRRERRTEEFKQLRQQFAALYPPDLREPVGPAPSPAASRLVGKGMLDFGENNQPGKTE